ncbi:MAG TPA: LacI family transcriptional regulator [bacterium]|nr:LacI family transcriptional regulator [bacterium]
MSVTIKDVAKRVGVTPTTVSMALKNDPRISGPTKTKVLDAVNELNYYPNYIGQALVKGKTDTIAVVSSIFFAWFKMDVLNGIGRKILETKYRMNHYAIRLETRDEELRGILHGKRADAVIAISFKPGDEVLAEFKEKGVPLVLIEDTAEGYAGVKVDNFKGAYMATDYLAKKGKKNIGFVSMPYAEDRGGYNVIERFEGYKKALADNKMDIRKRSIQEINRYTFDDGRAAMSRFLEGKKEIDAVFCAAGDIVSMGMIKEAKSRGLKIPGDISVVGYDDIVMSEMVSPALTTVKQPIFEMGQAAVRMVTDSLEHGGRGPGEVVIFQPELIIRESA